MPCVPGGLRRGAVFQRGRSPGFHSAGFIYSLARGPSEECAAEECSLTRPDDRGTARDSNSRTALPNASLLQCVGGKTSTSNQCNFCIHKVYQTLEFRKQTNAEPLLSPAALMHTLHRRNNKKKNNNSPRTRRNGLICCNWIQVAKVRSAGRRCRLPSPLLPPPSLRLNPYEKSAGVNITSSVF